THDREHRAYAGQGRAGDDERTPGMLRARSRGLVTRHFSGGTSRTGGLVLTTQALFVGSSRLRFVAQSFDACLDLGVIVRLGLGPQIGPKRADRIVAFAELLVTEPDVVEKV